MKRSSWRPASALPVLIATALAAASPAHADGPRDTLLSLYYGGKLGLSALAIGTALTEPAISTPERLVVGGASLLVGVPSAVVLVQARRGNAAALRRWRIAAFAVDATLSAVAIGCGIRPWADPDSTISEDYAGLALVTLGLAGALACAADLAPFEAE